MKNMEETNTTLDYYNRNANQYFNSTVNVNMSDCCDKFLKYVMPGGKIIDVGAGSGRDIKYFRDRGYDVTGIDASEEMCRLASAYTGIQVQCERIQDWRPREKFDGIWANASLLHLSFAEVEEFIIRVSDYLNKNGVLYLSMKKGIRTGQDNEGRYFTDFSDETTRCILSKNATLVLIEIWESKDELDRKAVRWFNLILKKYI